MARARCLCCCTTIGFRILLPRGSLSCNLPWPTSDKTPDVGFFLPYGQEIPCLLESVAEPPEWWFRQIAQAEKIFKQDLVKVGFGSGHAGLRSCSRSPNLLLLGMQGFLSPTEGTYVHIWLKHIVSSAQHELTLCHLRALPALNAMAPSGRVNNILNVPLPVSARRFILFHRSRMHRSWTLKPLKGGFPSSPER